MDTIDITVMHRPAGWKEIMTGPEMALWIRRRSKEQWMNPFPSHDTEVGRTTTIVSGVKGLTDP